VQYGQRLLEECGGKKQFLHGSSLMISADGSLFIAGPAVGAPVAAMTLEKLIALGARRVVMFGWCGAISRELKVGDVVVGGIPVSGEGTSRYYQTALPAVPSCNLVAKIGEILNEAGIDYTERNVWSTDAPYREDRIYIEKLHDDADVCCVDMEYSALCAVGAFRAVEFAAVFLVSDELYQERWQPGYTRREFRVKSKGLVGLLANAGPFGGE
jgi:uridine phosphorylase